LKSSLWLRWPFWDVLGFLTRSVRCYVGQAGYVFMSFVRTQSRPSYRSQKLNPSYPGAGSRLVVLMSNFKSSNPVKLDSVFAGSRLLFSRIEDRQSLQEFPIR
jgi:hypothetical protein